VLELLDLIAYLLRNFLLVHPRYLYTLAAGGGLNLSPMKVRSLVPFTELEVASGCVWFVASAISVPEVGNSPM
jgi:hypothetical protein